MRNYVSQTSFSAKVSEMINIESSIRALLESIYLIHDKSWSATFAALENEFKAEVL